MILIGLLAAATAVLPPDVFVVVGALDGKCAYWQSPDAYYEAATSLRRYLRQSRKWGGRKVIISVRNGTPRKCVDRAKVAATEAGFSAVSVRPLSTE